ncbi:hypothetical protein ACH5RR_021232 [Cinchona calisaya]|uniref:Uncharacterized protein n=1 Tax=Cinchona calisaya TaxID=153742 RepID=A0ABD2ZLP5_9GENT
MEKPEIWLPPLNSHGDYSVSVVASQLKESWYNPSICDSKILIEVNVSVAYYSEKSDTDITIKGLSVDRSFLIDSCVLDSKQSSREAIAEMFGKLYIPFELNCVVWRERDLDGFFKISSGTLENVDCLVKRISKFAKCIRDDDCNAGHNVLPLNLSISKMVRVPEFEIREWNSWFDEEIKDDPDFEDEYMEAISRPRTREEVECERVLARTTFKHWRR